MTTSSVSYRDVLRHREFLGLITAQSISEVGDQIARLALALVVLDRTGSAFGAAAAFAVSFLPMFLGSAVLGPLADRLSRRSVMLVSDVARAALIAFFALVAVGTTPLWLMFLLLFFAELFTPAFDAARTATIPDILEDSAECAAGFGLSRTVSLITQVVGLVVGGAIVGVLGPRLGLIVDAATFVLSFAVLLVMVRRRPAPLPGGASLGSLLRDAKDGVGQLSADPARKSLLLLAVASSLAVVAPEALALSYARDVNASDVSGAALVACVVGGAAVGSILVSRRRPLRQIELLLPLALGCGLILLLVAPEPPMFVAMPIWMIAGLLQAFLVPCMAFMTLLTPSDERGRIAGLSSSAWALATVVSFLFSGAVADLTSPAFAEIGRASCRERVLR
jgi:MFS family permease